MQGTSDKKLKYVEYIQIVSCKGRNKELPDSPIATIWPIFPIKDIIKQIEEKYALSPIIHLKDGSLSIEVLNANMHPVAVSLKLIEEEMLFGKIE